MDLDPTLAGVAAAAIAPTNLLVNYLTLGLYRLPGRFKPLVAFLCALLFIVLYQGYTGEIERASWNQILGGYPLAAFTATVGAGYVAALQKRVETNKVERKRKQDNDAGS